MRFYAWRCSDETANRYSALMLGGSAKEASVMLDIAIDVTLLLRPSVRLYLCHTFAARFSRSFFNASFVYVTSCY